MQKTILIILAACLASCAAPGPTQEEIDAATKKALTAQAFCALQSIQQIDDGISDAQSVALALSIACDSEYQEATVALGLSLDNDRQRRMWRSRRNENQSRIMSFLPSVMRYRSQR